MSHVVAITITSRKYGISSKSQGSHILFNCSVKQQTGQGYHKCSIPIFRNLIKGLQLCFRSWNPDMSMQACLVNSTKQCLFQWCEAINHSSSQKPSRTKKKTCVLFDAQCSPIPKKINSSKVKYNIWNSGSTNNSQILINILDRPHIRNINNSGINIGSKINRIRDMYSNKLSHS